MADYLETWYDDLCPYDDSWLTLTFLMARSDSVTYAFVWEKGETMDFFDSVVACAIKVDLCNQLNDFYTPPHNSGGVLWFHVGHL